MTFQPGQSGNPGGRGSEKPFRDALRLAISEAGGDRPKLRLVAESLVNQAVEGDVQAIKEIADRLDGKVPQAQILTGDENGGAVRLERVEWVVVRHLAADEPENTDQSGVRALPSPGSV